MTVRGPVPPSAPTEPAGARRTLLVLLAVATVEGIGNWLVPPVLPAIGRAEHLGPAGVGAIAAVGGAAEIPGYLMAGKVVARFGARRALWMGLAATVLADIVFLIGGDPLIYGAARVAQGFGAAAIWMGIVFTVIERRGRYAGRDLPAALVGYSLGHIVGPLIGGLGGIRVPFLVHAGLACPVLVAVWRLPGPPGRTEFRLLSLPSMRDPAFRYALAAWSMTGLALGFAQGTLPLHFAGELRQSGVGGLYAVTAAAAAVGAVTVGHLARTSMARVGVTIGLVLYAVGILAAGFSETLWIWLLALIVLGIGSGGVDPNLVGYVAHSATAERMIGVQTVTVLAFAVGVLVGPAVGGVVAERAGFPAASLTIVLPTLAFAIGSVWFLVRGRASGRTIVAPATDEDLDPS